MSSMSIDGFIAGILSSMKLSQNDEYPITKIEEKIVHAFNNLEQLAQRKNIELRFHCRLNPYNNQSPTIQYSLRRLEQSEMLKRDGQTIKILLSVEEAADILNKSPLSPSEWKLLTKNMQPDPFMMVTDMDELETLYKTAKNA